MAGVVGAQPADPALLGDGLDVLDTLWAGSLDDVSQLNNLEVNFDLDQDLNLVVGAGNGGVIEKFVRIEKVGNVWKPQYTIYGPALWANVTNVRVSSKQDYDNDGYSSEIVISADVNTNSNGDSVYAKIFGKTNTGYFDESSPLITKPLFLTTAKKRIDFGIYGLSKGSFHSAIVVYDQSGAEIGRADLDSIPLEPLEEDTDSPKGQSQFQFYLKNLFNLPVAIFSNIASGSKS